MVVRNFQSDLICEKKLNPNIKSDIYSLSLHCFDVPQREASENSYYFKNWHILIYRLYTEQLTGERNIWHRYAQKKD